MVYINEGKKLQPCEEEKLEYIEKSSKALIEFAPKSLRMIKFPNDFKFSLKTMETFLEHWRGRTGLSIVTSNFDYEKKEYMEIITKYKNDGVIKDFSIQVQLFLR